MSNHIKTMKSCIILLIFLFLSGCASSNSFGRFKGRALDCVVPVYQGQPPAEYTYQSLGTVEGYFKGQNNIFYSDMTMYVVEQALERMAQNAKAMGANAVINVKGEPGKMFNNDFHYTGEAVIFERLPE